VDALDAAQLPDGTLDDPAACGMGAPGWKPAVEPSPMRPHARHVYALAQPVIATHLRVVMIPDGGISRFRAHGVITDEGWRLAGLVHLNAMDRDRAMQALLACCGSTAWAEEMLARRPFADPDSLKTAAGETWRDLSTADHLEAFAAHPRIGETSPPATNTAATNSAATNSAATNSAWSAAEQSGTADADQGVMAELAEGNRAYEERFGHVFLIRAAGRSAEDVLAALRQRLTNDPGTEVTVAAVQQAEITQLRLDRLLMEGPSR
ncbi:MAG TPA: 2-oxo-4-hydroxy-4-carboxy-5-ureidoimidazoline decarboxylase, partial [Euzebya sp.]|nr:2-oxo-4-hydroxy-4-carboxy-5-ureidoimidazoline decarboxylase [Euzebya sp.]